MTAVKICGITRKEDALAAARLGAHALGFVFYARSARNVNPQHAAAIIRALPPFVTAVGLFVDASRSDVDSVIAQVPLELLQFHGDEPPAFCSAFALPYIKAARVRPGLDLLQYARLYESARGLLLDSFIDGTQGGTGKTFDWDLIPQALQLPVILSGGLAPDNVAAAIRRVKPWAVDVSSGVEGAPAIKDPRKMAAFFQGVRDADL